MYTSKNSQNNKILIEFIEIHKKVPSNMDYIENMYDPRNTIYCIKYKNPEPVGPLDIDTYRDDDKKMITLQFFSFDSDKKIYMTTPADSGKKIDMTSPADAILSRLPKINNNKYYDIINKYNAILSAYKGKHISFLTTDDVMTKVMSEKHVQLKSSRIGILSNIEPQNIKKKNILYSSFMKLYSIAVSDRSTKKIESTRSVQIQDKLLVSRRTCIDYNTNNRYRMIKMIKSYNDTFIINLHNEDAISEILSYPLDSDSEKDGLLYQHVYIWYVFSI